MKPIIPFLLLLSVLAPESWSQTVKVAALQTYSRMGDVTGNVARLEQLILQAAGAGAKVVVTPECAVQGYMDAARGVSWVRDDGTGSPGAVWGIAETVPGAITRHFGELAKTTSAYLCIGLIEKAGTNLYNSQILMAPDGRLVGHHRKKNLWPPGDSGWATKGDRPLQVVDTDYGRFGLMICFDIHTLLWPHRDAGTDTLLWSVGWYGPNTESWFNNTMASTVARDAHFSVVAANWSSEDAGLEWPGRGFSVVIGDEGSVLGRSRVETGSDIVYGEVKVGRTKQSSVPATRGTAAAYAPAAPQVPVR